MAHPMALASQPNSVTESVQLPALGSADQSRNSWLRAPRFVRLATVRYVALGCLALSVLSQTGCSLFQGLNNAVAYNSFSDDLVTGWRDTVWAKRAYNRQVGSLPVGQFESAFRDGFIDGYHNVAQGGNGCQPAIPPRKYWSWKYQTAEGQCKVQAWFQGWTYGAKAAEQDGLGFHRQIQVSGALEQSLRDHGYGVNPDCPTCPLPGSEIHPAMPLPIFEGSSTGTTTRPRVDAAMPPAAPARSSVRPVSYEVERLPPAIPAR